MLGKLSVRNTKRQFEEYLLYFVTLACVVALIYAFNALIFSDVTKILAGFDILPYIIATASILIVVVMGGVTSYMTAYMVRKRSREFSIYMLLGIPNHDIGRLLFLENILIGGLAFVVGIFIGILVFQFLNATIFQTFGLEQTFFLQFSLNAAGLTLLYYSVLMWYSLRKNRKRIKNIKVYDLLHLDKKNEKNIFKDRKNTLVVFMLSVILGSAGFLLVYFQPIGKGIDTLMGTVFLIIFLFSFAMSIPEYFILTLGNKVIWKYKKNRLLLFRGFTTKAQSMTITMGILTTLFMLSISFLGIGTTVQRVMNKNLGLCPFDIMILHNKELTDFSPYDKFFRESFQIGNSYSYAIYTSNKKEFLEVCNQTLTANEKGSENRYVEFENDTYIKQSDYKILREILGLDTIEINPNYCYIHCLPELKENFQTYIKERDKYLNIEGYLFSETGIFTEPFYQAKAYGNGLRYIIIVPDQAVEKMDVLYSLYIALTNLPLNSEEIEKIINSSRGLVQLDRSIGKTVRDSTDDTSHFEDKDYFSGKWVEKESMKHLYAMSICLYYLAFIFEVTGAAILATQVLSDKEKKQKRDNILHYLGMKCKYINKIGNRQILMIFGMPILPAFCVASSFIYVTAKKIELEAFFLPTFSNDFCFFSTIIKSMIPFLLVYYIYYKVIQIGCRRRCK